MAVEETYLQAVTGDPFDERSVHGIGVQIAKEMHRRPLRGSRYAKSPDICLTESAMLQ
jgi:hypothetical protein